MSISPLAPNPSLRILWVGPVIDERHFANPAVSAAASIWQMGLISSLLEQLSFGKCNEVGHSGSNAAVELISHLPCQSFPKGTLWPCSDNSLFPGGLDGHGIGYLNLPILRDWVLRALYSRKIGQVLDANIDHSFDLLVSYNAEAYVSASVAKWVKKRSLPWISIIADLPRHQPQVFLMNAKVSDADGRLFLSWKNFQDFAKPEIDLFLEGGVHLSEGLITAKSEENIFVDSESQIKTSKRIAYFGGLTTLGGIDLFLQATRHLLDSQYEFHIIGSGDTQAVSHVQSFAQADSRIHYHGPASERTLSKLGYAMDIFVDPRPMRLSENNFPSKLLTYLRFSKPIISTIGHGVPAEYKQVLIHLEQENPEALAHTIQSVCEWDQARAAQYQSTINDFVLNAKSWHAQGKRVVDWMRAIIKKKIKKYPL